jgi:hypothetical protein
MGSPSPTPLADFLSGQGRDGAGRSLEAVLAQDDSWLEHRHDFIQWLFPTPHGSAFNPGAPVLTPGEMAAIRSSAAALGNLRRALARMRAFYEAGGPWLTAQDHNHLRITRIIESTRLLLGDAEAAEFHRAILAREEAAGGPVNAASKAFWRRALNSNG